MTLNETTERLPYKRYHIFAFANPRSGDGLAQRFLADYPSSTERDVYFKEYRQTAECRINFYNVLEK